MTMLLMFSEADLVESLDFDNPMFPDLTLTVVTNTPEANIFAIASQAAALMKGAGADKETIHQMYTFIKRSGSYDDAIHRLRYIMHVEVVEPW